MSLTREISIKEKQAIIVFFSKTLDDCKDLVSWRNTCDQELSDLKMYLNTAPSLDELQQYCDDRQKEWASMINATKEAENLERLKTLTGFIECYEKLIEFTDELTGDE